MEIISEISRIFSEQDLKLTFRAHRWSQVHLQSTTGACNPLIGNVGVERSCRESKQSQLRLSLCSFLFFFFSTHSSPKPEHNQQRFTPRWLPDFCIRAQRLKSRVSARYFGRAIGQERGAAASTRPARPCRSVMPRCAGSYKMVSKAESCERTRLQSRILVPYISSERGERQGVILSSSDVRDAVVRFRKARPMPLSVLEACSIVGNCSLRQPVRPIQ